MMGGGDRGDDGDVVVVMEGMMVMSMVVMMEGMMVMSMVVMMEGMRVS